MFGGLIEGRSIVLDPDPAEDRAGLARSLMASRAPSGEV